MMDKKLHKSYRYKGTMLILGLLLAVFGLSFVRVHDLGRRGQFSAEEVSENVGNENRSLAPDFSADGTFSSHLPLVIIDTYGEQPKADSVWSDEKGYRVPADYDPYAYGTISIIDRQDGMNTLSDDPDLKSDIKIRLRGNSSLTFDKKQYFIKLVNEDGTKNEQNVLGMGKEWEWVLNISQADKSLLRNYMCLNIASKIMPYVPDSKFCEVIMIKDGKSQYQGAYLMMESVKRGKDRINIAKYGSNFKNNSYILRRDRYDESAVLLNNYGSENGLTPNFIELKYPDADQVSDAAVKNIENEISAFEKAIFSKDIEEYYTYSDYIDMDSFIDYFIINEFFGNYDSGYHSVYFYKNGGSKLRAGPVWDFDRAMDNFNNSAMMLDSTAMHDAPWFRQLLRDNNFTEALINRYHELRKTILSEEYLFSYMDETIEFLGSAQQRDWNRWSYFYEDASVTDEKDDPVVNVQTNYADEIEKMKKVIHIHGTWLDENIDSLYQYSEFDGTSIKSGLFYTAAQAVLGNESAWLSGVGAILFIVVFMVSVILIERN